MDWIAPLIALTVMEIVLGIDNIVFIAILASKLPAEQQEKARVTGLGVALVSRLLLLFCISWVLGLTEPVFEWTDLAIPESVFAGIEDEEHRKEALEVNVRDIILLVGGLFLIWKSVREIHDKVEGAHDHHAASSGVTFGSVIAQIAILDIVFSLDSVITAVGMVDDLWVMVLAVIIAIGVMIAFAGRISDFVDRHPTVKILALSFLLLIGVLLLSEAVGTPINKGYIYFAMAFSLLVEMLNLRMKRSFKPAQGPGAVATSQGPAEPA